MSAANITRARRHDAGHAQGHDGPSRRARRERSAVTSRRWAPDIGRVKWVEGSFAGSRTFVLQDFFREEPEPTFRRGDADGTGTVELTDSVFVLNWLFLGSAEPGCADAADSNDDGKVDLSDPIQVLGFLFLGSEAPPSPGPETCGDDPTPDELPYCRDAGCEPAGFSGG